MIARIIHRLHARPHFGTTQLAQALYLTQSHVGIDLAADFHRLAAGPLWKGMYPLRNRAKSKGYFDWTPPQGKGELERYQPGPNIAAPLQASRAVVGDREPEFDRLLDLLGGLDTEQAEILATCYALWNDSLLDGRPPHRQADHPRVPHQLASKEKEVPARPHPGLPQLDAPQRPRPQRHRPPNHLRTGIASTRAQPRRGRGGIQGRRSATSRTRRLTTTRTLGWWRGLAEAIREFLRRTSAAKIDRLSQRVTEPFRFLLRRKSLVERVAIDPQSVAITLYDQAGTPIRRGDQTWKARMIQEEFGRLMFDVSDV